MTPSHRTPQSAISLYSRCQDINGALDVENNLNIPVIVQTRWGIDIRATDNRDSLVSERNLIVTTTPSRTPLLHADQVQKGTHI